MASLRIRLLVAALCCALTAATSNPPHITLIVSDDLGWDGAYGGLIINVN